MPHVVLRGKVSLHQWSQHFSPIHEQTSDWLIKIDELYIDYQSGRALLPVVVIEEGHPQPFYMLISQKENTGVTVRIDPLTDPVKTRGVKRAVALVAEHLRKLQPELEVERHNLQDFVA